VKETSVTILGVDPGTQLMGYGLLYSEKGILSVLAYGVMELKKISDPYQKLGTIYERIRMLIAEYNPDVLAIEAPFYGKNVQSMLKLGRAQGVVIAAALAHKLKVYEYSPRKIKQSITGNGNASKEQIAAMLQYLLKLSDQPKYLDVTDAIAVAVCHSFQTLLIKNEQKTFRSWEDFIQKNKDRLV